MKEPKLVVVILLSVVALLSRAEANQQNPLADLPWQTTYDYWYNYPWQGFNQTTAALPVTAPQGLKTPFETINLGQPRNNPNIGAAIEETPNYMGLIWWDFFGGHHILSTQDYQWHLNSALPLQLDYVELVSGANVVSWWKIPAGDGRIGLTQILPDPHIGGWVTRVSFFTASVPEGGTTLALLALALLAVLAFKKNLACG